MAEILIVDDDEQICSALRAFLTGEGHEVRVASNSEDARAAVGERAPDLVLLDVRMPGVDGLETLSRLRADHPELAVVMMTAFGTSHTSIEAMRLGAFDHLMKPFDLTDLRAVVETAQETQRLSREASDGGGRESDEPASPPLRLVGASDAMQEVYKRIGRVAARGVPALLVGEPGTGKRTVAETIHASSARRARPFVTLSCRDLPAELLGPELFGSEAHGEEVAPRLGRLETAAGGTLLLENVGELAPQLQTRLLALLESGRFERLHGHASIPADVLLLAAGGGDLEERVRRGEFNEKLFDRLRSVSIHLPPLRRRREDLPELIEHLLRRINERQGLSIQGVDDRVQRQFESYPWPGNVGELENVLRRAATLANGRVITPRELGDTLREGWYVGRAEAESTLESSAREIFAQLTADGPLADSSPFHRIVARVERALVEAALAATGGNQVRASLLLGITRTTLRSKIEKFASDPEG